MMKPSFNRYSLALTLLFAVWAASVRGQEVINGNLIVNGNVEIHEDTLGFGLANLWDGTSLQPAFGLTINYAEMEPTANYNAPGHSTIMMQAAQELATFKWQGLNPSTGAIDLMQLTNDGLMVSGTQNTLPNQTLDAGDASILTRVLADARYLKAASASDVEGALVWGTNTLWTTYHSIALGHQSYAGQAAVSIGSGASHYGSGLASVAIGFWSNASGEFSTALGNGASANGLRSFAAGQNSLAQSERSIAIGAGSQAAYVGQITLGSFNVLETVTSVISPGDSLLVIGNGTADNARSNALVVKRNGNMEVKGTDLTVNGSKVLTQADAVNFVQHVDSSYVGAGSYATPWSSAVAIGHFSRAGESAIAIGAHSGMWEPVTSGVKSVALGFAARVPGDYAIAIGESNWGGGTESITIGKWASTHSSGAVALGYGAKANQPNQVVLGAFNEASVYTTTHYPTNDLLILGNGTADDARSNALVVKRNGNMEVKGTSLTVNGAEVLTETSAGSLFVTQSSASTTYLTVAAASTQYQTKPEGEVEFLTSEDLVAIQASIDAKIDEAELEAALEGLEPGTGGGNYLSKDPAVGLAYGTGSLAEAPSSSAIGDHVVARQSGQVVVGTYNDPGQTVAGSTPTAEDAVFVVGAGSGDAGDPDERKNALVVKRNGDISISGVLRVQPAGNLLMGEYDAVPSP
ncbi:MAG: hypothetical protein V4672_05040 [Verrucomicrobiota bacterium]